VRILAFQVSGRLICGVVAAMTGAGKRGIQLVQRSTNRLPARYVDLIYRGKQLERDK